MSGGYFCNITINKQYIILKKINRNHIRRRLLRPDGVSDAAGDGPHLLHRLTTAPAPPPSSSGGERRASCRELGRRPERLAADEAAG